MASSHSSASITTSRPAFYLLDTNILVHYIREDALMQQIEAKYSLKTETDILICEVTEGEMRSLAVKFGWGSDKQRHMRSLLSRFIVIPISFAGIYDAYARIDDYSDRQGIAMGKNDLWIAAVAHVTNARLLTTDKDFDHLNPVFLTRDYIPPYPPSNS